MTLNSAYRLPQVVPISEWWQLPKQSWEEKTFRKKIQSVWNSENRKYQTTIREGKYFSDWILFENWLIWGLCGRVDHGKYNELSLSPKQTENRPISAQYSVPFYSGTPSIAINKFRINRACSCTTQINACKFGVWKHKSFCITTATQKGIEFTCLEK